MQRRFVKLSTWWREYGQLHLQVVPPGQSSNLPVLSGGNVERSYCSRCPSGLRTPGLSWRRVVPIHQ